MTTAEHETRIPVDTSDSSWKEETSRPREGVRPEGPCVVIHSARHNWVELSVPCAVEAADQLNDFLLGFFAELQEEVRESVRTVLRELLLNAIEWGGRSDESKRVRIAILHGRRAVVCRVADPGNGFRMENIKHASICNPAGKPYDHMSVRQQMGMRPGGFGLAVVTGCVDELIYNDAGNEVVFVKYIDPQAYSAPTLDRTPNP